MPIYQKGPKESLGNDRTDSQTLAPQKLMELITSAIGPHVLYDRALGRGPRGFMKGRSCKTALTCLYDMVTHIVDEGKPVDIFYLDDRKTFPAISRDMRLQKLAARASDRGTLRRVQRWLDGRAQRLLPSGVPWGSDPGSAPFSIFINGLEEGIECTSDK